MKTCQNCGTTLDDGAAFCAQCGAPVPSATVPPTPESLVCPGCGTPLGIDDVFCQECGTPTGKTANLLAGLPTAFHAAKPANKEAGKQKKFSMKAIPIVIAAVVVIAVVAGIFLFGSPAKTHLLYLKDNEINMTALSKLEPFQLTDGLYDGGDVPSGGLNSRIKFSDDGKYMFYPENITNSYDMDLYYLNLKANNAKQSSAAKIDSGVSYYSISLDGTKVFYLKSDKLYFYNLKEKVKIDSDVSGFYISDDGLKLLYTSGDGKLYMKDMKSGDVEKIDNDALVQRVSPDLGKIYYLKNDDLYLKEAGKDKAKLDSDVSNVPYLNDTGEFYYVKSTTETHPLSDYVNDDMTSDADMTEPDYDDYLKKDNNGYSYFDSDAYYDDWDVYYAKQERDDLRDQLQYNTYTETKASLYFYDGKAPVKVTDNYNASMSGGTEKAMIVYSKKGSADVPKFNLSEITSYYDVQSALDAASYIANDVFIAIGVKETEIDQESAESFRFNTAGTTLYFLDNASEDSYELYSLAISGDTIGTPELFDEDVFYNYFVMDDSDSIVYFKDVDSDNNCGDLYVNKKNIDTDVYGYSMSSTGGKKLNLIYLADYDEDDYIGTLKQYNGKKPVKIADDVYRYLADDKGTIAYIANYDADDDVGDAYLYSGSKPKQIDDDVSYLLMIH